MLKVEITIVIEQDEQHNPTMTEIIEQSRLISFERPHFDRSDTNSVSFGIYSNQGTMTFNDLNDDFYGYAESDKLQDGLPLKIDLVNTISGRREHKGTFKTSDWDYVAENKQITVRFADDLTEWQDIKSDDLQITYDYSAGTSGTGETVYNFLYSKTPAKYGVLAFNSLDDNTKQVLQETEIPKLMLENDNLWRQWTKLCEACGLIIYKGENDTTICKALKIVLLPLWQTPTITLSGDNVSVPLTEGVTKYKVYSDSEYIGYVDNNNVWHSN